MEKLPIDKPPIVEYRTPSTAPRNTPGKFMGRMMLGIGLGIIACITGAMAYGMSASFIVGAVPIVLALAVAVNIGLRQRKYGYVTGVILAPFIIVVGLYMLLLAICHGSSV